MTIPSPREIAAKRLANEIPWFTGALDEAHIEAANIITDLWLLNSQIGAGVADLRWVLDGINTAAEVRALGSLRTMAMTDLELSRSVFLSWIDLAISTGKPDTYFGPMEHLASVTSSLSWLSDGMSGQEGAALQTLGSIADINIDAAILAAEYADKKTGDLGPYLIHAMWNLSTYPDAYAELEQQPWFIDGLDDDEAAFVVTLPTVYGVPDLYTELLEQRYVQTRVVSLSLVGEVAIRVFHNKPVPSGQDLTTTIASGARTIEDFLGMPFPTTDIISVVVDSSALPVVYPAEVWGIVQPEDTPPGWIDINVNTGTHIRISGNPGTSTIVHELAHYYFDSLVYPEWLREGAAHFMEAYFNDRHGISILEDRRLEVSHKVKAGCSNVLNIRHNAFLNANRKLAIPDICTRLLGEQFLLTMRELIGEESLQLALNRLLYWKPHGIDEAVIYQYFVANSPTDRQDAVRMIYRGLHGGPFPCGNVDHRIGSIEGIAVKEDEEIQSRLEGMLDFDCFRIYAEKGQAYRIALVFQSIPRSFSINLSGFEGPRLEEWVIDQEVSEAYEIEWAGYWTGNYYLTVQNHSSGTADYSMVVSQT